MHAQFAAAASNAYCQGLIYERYERVLQHYLLGMPQNRMLDLVFLQVFTYLVES